MAGLGRLYGQGSGFTYQGHLNDGGAAANGTYDLRFALFDAANGGNQVGLSLTNSGLAVITGSFGVSLDFGANAFTGGARWLELGARTNGEVAFLTLSPRQPITPTPYALYALTPAGPQGIKGDPGAPGEPGVPGLVWRGPWDFSTSYAANDAVQNGGSAWVATLANTGVTPTEGASWTLLAQKGGTGPQDATGATGSIGPTRATGTTGATGATGPQGVQGPQGVPGLTWRGAWSVSTSYATNDAVQSGGSAWVAKLASTGVVPIEGASWTMLAQKGDPGPQGATGPQGDQGPQGVPGLTWRGAWSVSTSYATNDAVQSGGSAWVAKLASTGMVPVEGASWTLLAQKGDTGPQGATGATGSIGPTGATGTTGNAISNSIASAHQTPAGSYTGWTSTGLVVGPANMSGVSDYFGGPPIWDSVSNLWRVYYQQSVSSEDKIYMATSISTNLNWMNPTLVFAKASSGWDAGDVGVPFVWCEPTATYPWRMIYRADATHASTDYLGFACSINGVTWLRQAPDGTALVAAIVPTGNVDSGNVMFYNGTYYLYYDTISARKVYCATSTDCKTWSVFGGGTPTALFSGVYSAANTWDYDDATHTSSGVNTAFGWHNPWVGRWDKADGTVQFVTYCPTQEHTNAPHYDMLTCFTSSDPYFAKANRTFQGIITQPSLNATYPQYSGGQVVTNSGWDVPRVYCDDITQQPLKSTRMGTSQYMWVSAQTFRTFWHTLMVRPVGFDIGDLTNAAAGTITTNLCVVTPQSSPKLQLASWGAPGYQQMLILPGATGTLRDWSGQGLHMYAVGTNSIDSNGLLLGPTAYSYVVSYPDYYFWGGVAGQIGGVLLTNTFTVDFTATKTATVGAGNYCTLLKVVGAAESKSLMYLIYNGSASDDATGSFEWNFWDSAGTLHDSYAVFALNWATGARHHIEFTWDNTNVWFFVDGTLSTAYASAMAGKNLWVMTETPQIYWGATSLGAHAWQGYLDELRIDSRCLRTNSYTYAPLVPTYTANPGYYYSGVIDMAGVSPTILGPLNLRIAASIPTTTSITVGYRTPASATDKSTTWANFSSTIPGSRYVQYAIMMQGDGNTPSAVTPSISSITWP